MHEVDAWLEALGLGHYAPLFAENHIDLAILRGMSEQDFKELGVGSFGHRRMIAQAVAKLGTPVAAGETDAAGESLPVSIASADAHSSGATARNADI